jgi:glycosyltransferase involved in cell wall biosynthesis
MRIQYLSSSRIVSDSANSVHVMKMCHAFAAAGHDITLSALAGSGEEEDAVFRYYGVERFPLIRHDEDSHPLVGMLWWLRRRVPSLRVGGVPSILFGSLRIAPMLRKCGPELVYARNLDWLAGLPPDLAFVAESHRPPSNRVEAAIERRLYRRRGFLRLVVISDKLREIYLSLFPWLREKILVAHDAADDPNPEAWARQKQPGFHVGYVGHLYAGRGTGLIVEMARALPSVTFHLVGGSEEDRRGLASSGLSENVRLHGHHPPSELANFFGRFDAVLAPYQRKVAVVGGGDTSAYMSPLKLFEYMSWGKPILCSDLPVLREIIADGRNGRLLPPADSDAWVAALGQLIDNPHEGERLGKEARADFLARHTWRQRVNRVLDGLQI